MSVKSVAAFIQGACCEGVSREQLMEWVKNHKISDWTFKVHASARLAKRLFAGEVLVRSIV